MRYKFVAMIWQRQQKIASSIDNRYGNVADFIQICAIFVKVHTGQPPTQLYY